MVAAIRAVVLLGLAVLIGRLFVTGEMVKYMSPALDPLTALAGAVAGLLGLYELSRAVRQQAGGSEAGGAHWEGFNPDGHAAGHWSDRLVTAAVILVPVVVGLAVTPRALGVGALGGEPVSGLLLALPPGQPGGRVGAASPADRPIEDVPDLLRYLRERGDGAVGQRVRVTGIVAPGSDLADDELALLRFSIAHCVADARPLALLVVTADGRELTASAGALDQWLLVEGSVTLRERDGDRIVAVAAERVERIAEPANPYLPAAY